MKVGERIRAEREAQGISRRELSDSSGVPYPTLAGLENGDQANSTALPAIAGALSVNARWLQTGKGHKDAPSQLMGFEVEKILDAQKLLREYAPLRREPLTIADNARYVRIAYKIIDEDSRQESRGTRLDLVKQLSAALDNERRESDGDQRREAEGTGKGDGGDRAGRARKAKTASN